MAEPIVSARDVTKLFGAKAALDGVSVDVLPGDIVGVLGKNGAGKTTLLETLLGRREPDAGTIRMGHGVQPAYFSQHDVELDERGTVLECAMSMTGLARPQAQQLLGRFLFSG
ncbi:MAG: ABC transporter ATP-binding protein, partial [Lysobacterales bacterium]